MLLGPLLDGIVGSMYPLTGQSSSEDRRSWRQVTESSYKSDVRLGLPPAVGKLHVPSAHYVVIQGTYEEFEQDNSAV